MRSNGTFREPPDLYLERSPGPVLTDYLTELGQLVARSSHLFQVLAHIDYPVRAWPRDQPPFEPADFEDHFRHILRTTAEAGLALEVNTTVPLHSTLLRWWREEGGQTITFGSDAHEPEAVARNFPDATAMAAAHGFAPCRGPFDPWRLAA